MITAIPEPGWKARFRQLLKIGLLGFVCALPKLVAWIMAGTILESPQMAVGRAYMTDSFGAAKVLHDAFTGELMDHGRLPVLTLLVAFGIAISVLRRSPQTSFVFVACTAWLALYFGRPLWGDALYLVGITPAMQLHRLIGPVQIFAVLLAAIGISWAWERSKASGYVMLAIGVMLSPAIQERRTYLEQNAKWRSTTCAAFTVDGPNIEAALAVAKHRGGRAYAGLPLTYGASFRIGGVPVYSLFPPRQIPCVGYLYISFLPQNWAM